jgi:hypothetical protein
MTRRKVNLGRRFVRKSAKEAKGVAKGIAREGVRIVKGTITGFFNAFNPFR